MNAPLRIPIVDEDHARRGSKIGTGIFGFADESTLTVAFSGRKEQLIATGLVTAAMFPEGMTAGGKERMEKRSPRNAETAWRVCKYGDEFLVYFYVPRDNGMMDVRNAYLAAELRSLARRSQRGDDVDDGDGWDDE